MNKAKKSKKAVWQHFISMAIMMLIGMIFGYVITIIILIGTCVMLLHPNIPIYQIPLSFAVLIVAIYPALILHIIVHEAGHLLFGLLTGYKFSSFRIFSFMLLKENGKLRFKRFSLAGTGGQCLMIPPDMRDSKIPIVLYNLGGSFLNAAVATFFFVASLLCFSIPYISALFLTFSFMGFMLAISNGIPMRMGMVDNDGYNAISLSKNPEALKAFWIQLKVNEQISKGVRTYQMPEEWFSVPTDDAMKNSMVAVCGVLACNRLMDEKEFEKADALMSHLLEIDSNIVGIHRNLLMCDRIYIELIGENRRDIIENMLTKNQKNFMKAMKRYPSVLRTEYALALLFNNDSEKSEKIQKTFNKTAKTYPYPGESHLERELMEIAKSKAITKKSTAI